MSALRQSGSALLAVLVLTAAGASLTLYAAARVRGAGRAVAARGDVLCANFAASGAVLTAPGSFVDAHQLHPALERVTSRISPIGSHCVFVVEAVCGRATRRRTRDIDPEFCARVPP